MDTMHVVGKQMFHSSCMWMRGRQGPTVLWHFDFWWMCVCACVCGVGGGGPQHALMLYLTQRCFVCWLKDPSWQMVFFNPVCALYLPSCSSTPLPLFPSCSYINLCLQKHFAFLFFVLSLCFWVCDLGCSNPTSAAEGNIVPLCCMSQKKNSDTNSHLHTFVYTSSQPSVPWDMFMHVYITAVQIYKYHFDKVQLQKFSLHCSLLTNTTLLFQRIHATELVPGASGWGGLIIQQSQHSPASFDPHFEEKLDYFFCYVTQTKTDSDDSSVTEHVGLNLWWLWTEGEEEEKRLHRPETVQK